ncbi:MAG: HNH endonuclease signature motif containing protein [Planctomycetaceae bacterium]
MKKAQSGKSGKMQLIERTMEQVARRLQKQYGNRPLHPAEIEEQVVEECGAERGSVNARDYCYNRKNKDVLLNKKRPMFEYDYDTPPHYRFLGFDHPYSGLCYQHPKGGGSRQVIGHWVNGEYFPGDEMRRTVSADLDVIAQRKLRGEIDSTTAVVLTEARIGQGGFRTAVLRLWDNRCCVTGSVAHEAIRASHIKPWRESNDQQRLDPHNGLPLVASLDALFDAGLISFDANGKLLVSPRLPAAERRIFGLKGKNLTRRPSAKTAEHLADHYSKRFKQ